MEKVSENNPSATGGKSAGNGAESEATSLMNDMMNHLWYS